MDKPQAFYFRLDFWGAPEYDGGVFTSSPSGTPCQAFQRCLAVFDYTPMLDQNQKKQKVPSLFF
jgi:hypothetical protein